MKMLQSMMMILCLITNTKLLSPNRFEQGHQRSFAMQCENIETVERLRSSMSDNSEDKKLITHSEESERQ
jgi:hypothetical protein